MSHPLMSAAAAVPVRVAFPLSEVFDYAVPPGAAIPDGTPVIAPLAISHQAQFPAATLSFNLAPEISLGEAVSAVTTPP